MKLSKFTWAVITGVIARLSKKGTYRYLYHERIQKVPSDQLYEVRDIVNEIVSEYHGNHDVKELSYVYLFVLLLTGIRGPSYKNPILLYLDDLHTKSEYKTIVSLEWSKRCTEVISRWNDISQFLSPDDMYTLKEWYYQVTKDEHENEVHDLIEYIIIK